MRKVAAIHIDLTCMGLKEECSKYQQFLKQPSQRHGAKGGRVVVDVDVGLGSWNVKTVRKKQKAGGNGEILR